MVICNFFRPEPDGTDRYCIHIQYSRLTRLHVAGLGIYVLSAKQAFLSVETAELRSRESDDFRWLNNTIELGQLVGETGQLAESGRSVIRRSSITHSTRVSQTQSDNVLCRLNRHFSRLKFRNSISHIHRSESYRRPGIGPR